MSRKLQNGFHPSNIDFAFSLIFENPASAVAEPVLQCVQIKPLAGQQGAAERFRIVLSDIDNFVQCMLATRMFTVA